MADRQHDAIASRGELGFGYGYRAIVWHRQATRHDTSQSYSGATCQAADFAIAKRSYARRGEPFATTMSRRILPEEIIRHCPTGMTAATGHPEEHHSSRRQLVGTFEQMQYHDSAQTVTDPMDAPRL